MATIPGIPVRVGYELIQLVRVRMDDEGKKVNWIATLAGLGDLIAEGRAYEAIMENGEASLKRVNSGCTVRLYTEKIVYVPFPYFVWWRRGDPNWGISRIPCIAFDDVPSGIAMNDPEYRTLPRTIATLTPVLVKGEAGIALSFVPEA